MRQYAIIILIVGWLGWHLARPVDLLESDLGRHIKNGELILHGNSDVLFKNYYSYTYPDYPFVNYHWLFGVLCYTLWHYFGFCGLSLAYLILELLTFYVFFLCCRRYSSLIASCAFALLSFPLICFRNEIRPEGISYLFCGLFWWLIGAYQQKQLKSRYLMIGLCILQMIWVNTHIFFLMGPILAAIFWWQARLNKEKRQANDLQKLFLLLIGMCFINPFGFNIFLTPLETWHKAASFPIIESLSVFSVFNEKIVTFMPVLEYFLTLVIFLGVLLFCLIQRGGVKKYIFTGSLSLILSFAGMKVMRMIGLFGYCWMPLSAYFYGQLMQAKTAQFKKSTEIILLAAGIAVSVLPNLYLDQKHTLGINPGSKAAAEFFKREHITGPIFNNYGMGGYLIFYLSPQHQLFVDNRGLAAFPEDFINKTYIQMQEDDHWWHQLDLKYHFNVIFCSQEHSSWAAQLMANRLADHDWALVFQNKNVRILLKRNSLNSSIIRQYEIHVPLKGAMDFYNEGTISAEQGDYTKALSNYDKAIDLDPNYAFVYNNRGTIYAIQGDVRDAINDFDKAIAINPDYADAYKNRAFSYYQLRNYDKALKDAIKAEALGAIFDPNFLKNLNLNKPTP